VRSEVQRETGHAAEALADARRALAIDRVVLPPEHPGLADAQLDLARALVARGRDRAQARALAAAARATYVKAGRAAQVAEVDAWLTSLAGRAR
jgi:hypothetical protein